MAVTGKDGITHFSWQDVFNDLDGIKLGPRRVSEVCIIRAGKRKPDAPCGTLTVEVQCTIWLPGTTKSVTCSGFVHVTLKRRVYLADAVHEASLIANRAASNAWIDAYGADWWLAS